MSTFYPSCVVHLVVRFDEALIAGASVPKAVSTEEAARLPASVVLPDAEKPLLAQKMSSGGFTNDGESSFVLNIVPKRCSVEKGGVRAAGTFNIQLAWQDLPLDPRTIRALGVEVHMGTVSAEDFARGMDGDRRADGSLYSILRTRDPGGRLRAGTLVMLGIADEVSEEYGQDGIGLTITGRDQRGILLSSPLPPDALNKLDYSRAIPEIIEETWASKTTSRTDVIGPVSENTNVVGKGGVRAVTPPRCGSRASSDSAACWSPRCGRRCSG